VIEVRTYSPYLKAYLRDASNQFELKYAPTPAGLGVGHLAAASLQAGLLAACLIAAVVIAALEEHTLSLLTLNFQTPLCKTSGTSRKPYENSGTRTMPLR
jgi:hypothetical protein